MPGVIMQMDGFEHDQLLENRLFAAPAGQPEVNQVSFLDRVAEGTTAPGGGSAAAHVGALGAALAVMVARLTGRKNYQDVETECWQTIEKGEQLRAKLTEAIETDAKSFDGIIQARRLPKDSEENQKIRENAIMEASYHAAVVPLRTTEMCLDVMRLALRMAEIGNVNCISDAASGVYQAYAGMQSAFLNVKINLIGYEAEPRSKELQDHASNLIEEAALLLHQLKTILAERAQL